MNRNFYVVTFIDVTGAVQSSQTFATIVAARRRARWYAKQSWAKTVCVVRGGIGAEVVECFKV